MSKQKGCSNLRSEWPFFITFDKKFSVIKYIKTILITLWLGCILQQSTAQELTLTYADHIIIPEKAGTVLQVGGLSGIAYSHYLGSFLACADKPPARLIAFSYHDKEWLLEETEVVLLQPNLLSNSELEGIALDHQKKIFYLSDEQAEGTRIISIDPAGLFKEIILPKNLPFLPLSGYNSGIEGLTLAEHGRNLYFAFERPTPSCVERAITTIGKLDLQTNELSLYPYLLHEVQGDHLLTNGISDILWLDDERLLVMERAYLPGTGNVVRLYDTKLSSPGHSMQTPIDCTTEEPVPMDTKIVFDFASVQDIKIDNAEGMTFNKDRSELIIVTDNNFSGKQETQLVVLNVGWNSGVGSPE